MLLLFLSLFLYLCGEKYRLTLPMVPADTVIESGLTSTLKIREMF